MAQIGPSQPWPLHVIGDAQAGADGVRLADINGDGRLDVATGFEEGGLTRVFLHPGAARVQSKWPAVTVGQTLSVEDAVFMDLDGDGVKDVISSCEGGTLALFVQWAPGKDALLNQDAWRQEAIPAADGTMRWMFATPFALRDRDAPVLMAGGKGEGAAVGWFEPMGKPRDLARYVWHPLAKLGWLMSLLPHDMDGDGDLDLLFTDRRGALRGCRWLEQPDDGVRAPWKDHYIGGKGEEVMFLKLADLDGDGIEEVVMTVRPHAFHILKRRNAAGTKWDETIVPYPEGTGGAKGIAVGDLNGDGLADIALTCEHAVAPLIGVVWLEQTPGTEVASWPAHAIATPAGIKYDRIELLDLDGDGDLDLMTCEERENQGGLGLIWYENPYEASGR